MDAAFSHGGGERAAAIYTLLETCWLNAVNPQEWLVDVLDHIGQGHPVNRLDELLPWQWKASLEKATTLRPIRSESELGGLNKSSDL